MRCKAVRRSLCGVALNNLIAIMHKYTLELDAIFVKEKF